MIKDVPASHPEGQSARHSGDKTVNFMSTRFPPPCRAFCGWRLPGHQQLMWGGKCAEARCRQVSQVSSLVHEGKLAAATSWTVRSDALAMHSCTDAGVEQQNLLKAEGVCQAIMSKHAGSFCAQAQPARACSRAASGATAAPAQREALAELAQLRRRLRELDPGLSIAPPPLPPPDSSGVSGARRTASGGLGCCRSGIGCRCSLATQPPPRLTSQEGVQAVLAKLRQHQLRASQLQVGQAAAKLVVACMHKSCCLGFSLIGHDLV